MSPAFDRRGQLTVKVCLLALVVAGIVTLAIWSSDPRPSVERIDEVQMALLPPSFGDGYLCGAR
jgi:hypothetical protein